MAPHIAAALAAAETEGVAAKAVTPFLLARIGEHGRCLRAALTSTPRKPGAGRRR
jgi:pseudouridine-5'-phosphate glycosidase